MLRRKSKSMPEFLTTSEVAARLRVTESIVSRLCCAGEFPGASKPGKSWLIPPADVDAYIESGRVKPAEAPEKEAS